MDAVQSVDGRQSPRSHGLLRDRRAGSLLGVLLALSSVVLAGCVTPAQLASAPGAAGEWLPTNILTLHGPTFTVNEAPVAIDPLDPDHWVVIEYSQPDHWVVAGVDLAREPPVRTGWFYTHVTRDGGETWTRHAFPGGPLGDPSHPLFRKTHLRYPTIHIAADGTVLVAGVAFNAVRSGEVGGADGLSVFLGRSFDGGETFPEVVHLTRPSPVPPALMEAAARVALDSQGGQMFSFAEAPDGTLRLAFLRYPPQPPGGLVSDQPPTAWVVEWPVVVLLRSTDVGRSWSAPELITDPRVDVSYPLVGVGSDATEYVFYVDRTGFTGTPLNTSAGGMRLAIKYAGGSSSAWRVVELPDTGMYADFRVERRGTEDRLWIAYTEFVDPQTHLVRTRVIWSDDRGLTWSVPLLISEPAFGGATFPLVAPDGTGGAVVTAYHPVEEKGFMEYRAWTLRDGAVSEPMVIGGANAHGRTRNLGHQMGLVTHPGGGVLAAWIDGDAITARSVENELYLRAARLVAI